VGENRAKETPNYSLSIKPVNRNARSLRIKAGVVRCTSVGRGTRGQVDPRENTQGEETKQTSSHTDEQAKGTCIHDERQPGNGPQQDLPALREDGKKGEGNAGGGLRVGDGLTNRVRLRIRQKYSR